MRLSSHRTGYGYQTLHLGRAASDPSHLSIIRRLRIDEGPIIINEPIDAIGLASSTLGERISVADQVLGYLLVESAVHGFYTASHADRLGAIADQAGAACRTPDWPGVVRAGGGRGTAAPRPRVARCGQPDPLDRRTHRRVAAARPRRVIAAVHQSAGYTSSTEAHCRRSRLLLELRPADLTEVSLPRPIGFLLTALECRRTSRST